MAKDAFSAHGAAQRIRARKDQIDSAVKSTTESKKAKPKKSKSRKVGSAPLSEIKKTKHKGAEGETSYGQRMNEPVIGQAKTRFSQSGEN